MQNQNQTPTPQFHPFEGFVDITGMPVAQGGYINHALSGLAEKFMENPTRENQAAVCNLLLEIQNDISELYRRVLRADTQYRGVLPYDYSREV